MKQSDSLQALDSAPDPVTVNTQRRRGLLWRLRKSSPLALVYALAVPPIFYREPAWRMNYAITPCEPNGLPFQAFPKRYWQVGSIKRSSDKVLFVEHHYEGSWGVQATYLNAQSWFVEPPYANGGVLNTGAAVVWPSSGHISPPRHRKAFVAAFCDGSARMIKFSERDALVKDPLTGNKARDGAGPNWDLTR